MVVFSRFFFFLFFGGRRKAAPWRSISSGAVVLLRGSWLARRELKDLREAPPEAGPEGRVGCVAVWVWLQSFRVRVTQVLVFGSIYQGAILGCIMYMAVGQNRFG